MAHEEVFGNLVLCSHKPVGSWIVGTVHVHVRSWLLLIYSGSLDSIPKLTFVLSVVTGYPGDPWVTPSQPRASGVTYIAPRLPRGPAGIREGIQAPIERAPTGLDRLKRIWPLHFLFRSV